MARWGGMVDTNNIVKLGRFIVPKNCEQINDYLFIDSYKSNKIKLAWMKCGWTIAKWVWDETTKLAVYNKQASKHTVMYTTPLY